MSNQRHIAVIGLGYVGLPVALAFATQQQVVGFDTSLQRIQALQKGQDVVGEIPASEIMHSNILFTADKEPLRSCDFYIVTVPTPLDENHIPDLSCLHKACDLIGSALKKGDIVVFESTVYPGATQEECIPRLEHRSALKAGVDFAVGYSPERINPSDQAHAFVNTNKIIAALDPETLDIMADVYGQVISAQLTRASSIKVAEAAKILENTQRDVNIALMNEFAIACAHLGIDTHDVIHAASSKWNFMPFSPGLVGGHCIGVAPHYLAYKAKHCGYEPRLISQARQINQQMGTYIANETIKLLIQNGSRIKNAHVAILGITFKENCPDVRNSCVIDVIHTLQEFGIEVSVHDPIANKEETLKEYDIELVDWDEIAEVEAIVLCVAHRAYEEISAREFADKFSGTPIMMDVKAMLDREIFAANGVQLWRL